MRLEEITKWQYWRLSKLHLLTAAAVIFFTVGFALLSTNYVNAQKHITLDNGGVKKQFITGKERVMDVLYEQSIKLGPDDLVEPALTTKLDGDITIKITQVKKQIITQEKTVAFNIIKKTDHALPDGTNKVIKAGQSGKVLEYYEVVYKNGKEASRKLVRSQVLQNKQDSIVAVGDGRLLASRGATSRSVSVAETRYGFTPRKTLTIRMTAYSAANSQYNGYTASGVLASEGRTIAVDPGVVPLGWWVYIEGYGFRRAEDTGGAIKGNRMDLFFQSEATAHQFGVQTRTVYVVGPRKP